MSSYAARMIASFSARYLAMRAGDTFRARTPVGVVASALIPQRYANGVFVSGRPGRTAWTTNERGSRPVRRVPGVDGAVHAQAAVDLEHLPGDPRERVQREHRVGDVVGRPEPAERRPPGDVAQPAGVDGRAAEHRRRG